MELLIALIPALPLAGFLFAVLVGPRFDRAPLHGHHGGHEGPGDHREQHGEAAAVDAHAKAPEDEAARSAGEAGHDYPETHGLADADHSDDPHGPLDDTDFRSVPTEEEQRITIPHAGHSDEL